jgi:hypothetical protein
MTRLERNRMRKRRRRSFFFSFLFCFVLFILGIYAVNHALVSTMNIADQDNIFSMHYIGHALKEMNPAKRMTPFFRKFDFIIRRTHESGPAAP